MKVAVIGSRKLIHVDIGAYLPMNCDEIVSGGACGIDTLAETYANEHNIPLTVFLPEYEKFGRAAPIVRNKRIVEYADEVLAFWDGVSKGTLSVIKYAQKIEKPCRIIYP